MNAVLSSHINIIRDLVYTVTEVCCLLECDFELSDG